MSTKPLAVTLRRVPQFELSDDQRRDLEKSAREVTRLEQRLNEAKARRNGLVIAVLQQHGDQRGAVPAVARAAGLTPEAVRQLHRNPDAPWDRRS